MRRLPRPPAEAEVEVAERAPERDVTEVRRVDVGLQLRLELIEPAVHFRPLPAIHSGHRCAAGRRNVS